MKPTLNQIEAMYWIARLESFHAAAAQLNITQPTISLRVRALERALKVRLFERRGRGMILAAEGVSLLPWVERMMALTHELSNKHARVDPLRGRLRLGAPDSFGMICMPALIEVLKRQFKELNIVLSIDHSAVLNEMLVDRKLDVAFLVDPNPGAHVRTELLGPLEHRWVGSKRLGLRRRHLRPEDLVNREIITNPAPSALMSMVMSWFNSAGLAPSHLGTCNSLMVIMKLIADGAGFSLLPTSILSAGRAAGRLQAYYPQPDIVSPRLFAAYQLDKDGACVQAVVEAARSVMARANYFTVA